MKGPPKLKKTSKSPTKVGSGVTGGNMSGLAQALMAARPKKMGRVSGAKKSMFGGGM